jgi:hypothetical protein
MKRGTPDHWKMKDLARRLNVPVLYALPWANGIMERIWHYAEKYCVQGDIGKVPNEEIAEVCCWPIKRANELVDALVSAKWLDISKKHRLLIHDWEDHCTDAVKKTLNRKGLCAFCPDKVGKVLEMSGKNPPALPSLTKPEPLPPPPPDIPPLTGDEVEQAWDDHRSYKNGESLDHAVRIIQSVENFDVVKFRERGAEYREYYEQNGWSKFGCLTLIGWIQAGCPYPPARKGRDPTTAKKAFTSEPVEPLTEDFLAALRKIDQENAQAGKAN